MYIFENDAVPYRLPIPLMNVPDNSEPYYMQRYLTVDVCNWFLTTFQRSAGCCRLSKPAANDYGSMC